MASDLEVVGPFFCFSTNTGEIVSHNKTSSNTYHMKRIKAQVLLLKFWSLC